MIENKIISVITERLPDSQPARPIPARALERHPHMTLRSASKNRMALLAVCLGALMFGLEITSVPVILPTLERTLGGSFQEMQWVMNAYTLACTTVLMERVRWQTALAGSAPS
jgi:hypothetical protein